jgi:hypothetical protein
MTAGAETLKYEEIESRKRFRVEPSRRGTKKRTDPEQLRIFVARQKRLPALWRDMGIVSWKSVKEALIKWDSQGPKALEQGSGRSPEGVNQCFLNNCSTR